MKELNPAKVVFICLLFLLVLYFTSGVDLAISATLAVGAFLFNLSSVWLFIASFSVFAVFLLFNILSIKLDLIADLFVSSFQLFAAAIVLYFREGQKNKWLLKLPLFQKIEITSVSLLKFAGILTVIFLIYPLTNVYIAVIAAYIIFQVAMKKSDGRFAFAVSLFFLILCLFLLIAKKDKLAEASAIFTYYFLIIGVFQEAVNFIRNPQADDKREEKRVESTLHSEKLKSFVDKIEMPGKNFAKLIVVGLISLVISFILIYFLFSFFHNRTFSLPKISFNANKKVKPTIAPTTTSTPTPTLTFAEVTEKVKLNKGEVKLLVENGTEITGLAASTAAILREDGFVDIVIGNAERQDYKNWEITLKQKDDIVVEYLKYLLNLTVLDTKEATEGAEYDMELIIGEMK